MAFKQDYNRLLAQVRTEMPGLTDGMVRQQLFPVFQQFYRETKAWQQDLSVPIVAGTVLYTVVNPSFGTFEGLLSVTNSANQAVSAFLPTITSSTAVLKLRFPTSSNDTFTVNFSMNVGSPIDKTGLPEIPDNDLNQWGDVVFEGICARLMLQPNKPYSDRQLGNVHFQKFKQGIAYVRQKVLHQNLWGAQAWSFPQDFQSHGQRGGISTTGFGFTS